MDSTCPLLPDLVTLVGRYADLVGRRHLRTLWPNETCGLHGYEAIQVRAILATHFKCNVDKLDTFLQKHQAVLTATDAIVVSLVSENESERACATTVDMWVPNYNANSTDAEWNGTVKDLVEIFPSTSVQGHPPYIHSDTGRLFNMDHNSKHELRCNIKGTRLRTPWNSIVYDGRQVLGSLADFTILEMRWASAFCCNRNQCAPSSNVVFSSVVRGIVRKTDRSKHTWKCLTCNSSWCRTCIMSRDAEWHTSVDGKTTFCRACLVSSRLVGVADMTAVKVYNFTEEWQYVHDKSNTLSIIIYPEALMPADNNLGGLGLDDNRGGLLRVSSDKWLRMAHINPDRIHILPHPGFDVKICGPHHIDIQRTDASTIIRAVFITNSFGESFVKYNVYCVLDGAGLRIMPRPPRIVRQDK